MGPFWEGCNTLKGVPWAIEKKLHFSAHSQWIKGYSGFRFDQESVHSIGVAWGVLHTLVWIFEYVTNWLFAGP